MEIRLSRRINDSGFGGKHSPRDLHFNCGIGLQILQPL